MSEIYLWEDPENYIEKTMGVYDENISPNRFLLRKGRRFEEGEFGLCHLYVRSQPILESNLNDDPLVINELRPKNYAAYIFALNEMFYFDGLIMTKINMDLESINKLKERLGITNADIDKLGKPLTDEQLAIIAATDNCPRFSRIPIITFKVSQERLRKFDCLMSTANVPVINQKTADILFDLVLI